MAQACVDANGVIDLAPELGPTNPVLELVVVITCKMITLSFDIWGDLADEGHRTLAAHFATLILGGGASGSTGPVTSRTLDKLSESYAAGAFDDAELSATKYGRLHLALLGSLRTQRAVSDGTDPPEWELPDRRIA